MRFGILLVPVMAVGLLAACGSSTPSSGAATTVAANVPTTTAVGALPKPVVKLPATLPKTLVITDLKQGTGTAAANGDTVVVHYIGVRSADGQEFDNSFDRGTPLPVTLGVGQVIKGWDQGLIGVKPGGTRQLDIPADLAYADAPPSSQNVIQKGDALSFVVEVVAVIPKPNPADAPAISIPPTPNQTTQTFTDLIVGTGPTLQPGQTVALQFLAFSASTGQQIASSWEQGTPMTFVPGGGQLPPGLEK
ncbi:MAG: FKBP-type peptidyl-prolyl cis-trans isomerase, partial [Ilumatobacteraceae bacterium]